jgi:hypothetical protein
MPIYDGGTMLDNMERDYEEILQAIKDIKEPMMIDSITVEAKSIYEQVKEIGGQDLIDMDEKLDDLERRKMDLALQIKVKAESLISKTESKTSDVMDVFNRKKGSITDAEIEEQVKSLEKVATADKKRKRAKRTPEMIRAYWLAKLRETGTTLDALSMIHSVSAFLRAMLDSRSEKSLGKKEKEIIKSLLPNVGTFNTKTETMFKGK